ncbi:hypothetical protein [Streptomyces sp. SID3343]|uniref:hypothetical protein n=1 Tax=Streptomyces sp. SID3343 TaxID=2690260 RepID=UPI001368A081|nr:hypothetical protein [Streptomyces sp. SID3343]MYW03326.1 hypothetical protein [Streptomyces sp. SID3343]MYW04719.1 hypothetical protein [Streptomyces sp. SID3343]
MSSAETPRDRLTGRRVAAPTGRSLLGRYVLVNDPGAEPSAPPAGGVAVDAAALRGAERAAGPLRWEGEHGPGALPGPLILDNVVRIANAVTADRRDGASPARWAATPPLIADDDTRLDPHPLDDAIRAELGGLERVCASPYARLRTEDVLVRAGRARRITWRTAVHLSAHSETWAARRLHGVEPSRLLVPIQVPDYDLYENRVVAALLDRLWQHVAARVAELDSIGRLVERGRRLLAETADRPRWQDRNNHYRTLAVLLADPRLPERVDAARARLETLRHRLGPLLDSPLRRAIRVPYDGRPQLRPTNLFANHDDYRRCHELWNTHVRLHATRDRSHAAGETDVWCRAFSEFSLLLLVRALEQLGLSPKSPGTEDSDNADGFDSAPGFDDFGFHHHRHASVVLRRDLADDTFTLVVDARPTLRVVPLAHAVTAVPEPGAVQAWLETLWVPSPEVPSAPRPSEPTPPEPRVAVLYPADPGERPRLPPAVRAAAHSTHGTRGDGRALPALVPVGPTDVDSVTRVARLLRTALDCAPLADYPRSVRCPSGLARRLAENHDWLEVGPDESLLPTRPPSEAQWRTLATTLRSLRAGGAPGRRGAGGLHAPDPLEFELRDAVDELGRLPSCPVCTARARDFQARDGLTYRCVCSCGVSWENRRCGRCGTSYAVLLAVGADRGTGGHGDHLDHTFGQDLLAEPCHLRARTHICPSCGHCDRSDRSCRRCAATAAPNRPGPSPSTARAPR